MEAVVPWALLLALIKPYYPKAGNGRRPYSLAVMLRIYFLQHWYQLSDPGAEEALYDIQSTCLSALVRSHRNALWISRRYPNVRDASRDAVAWFPQDVA